MTRARSAMRCGYDAASAPPAASADGCEPGIAARRRSCDSTTSTTAAIAVDANATNP